MVTNLLSNILELRTDKLISLTENRIKWLTSTSLGASILTNTKASNMHDSNTRLSVLISFHQRVFVFHDFHDFLNHRYRLIHIHRHTKLAEILANRSFQYLPDRWPIIWISQHGHLIAMVVFNNIFLFFIFFDLIVDYRPACINHHSARLLCLFFNLLNGLLSI